MKRVQDCVRRIHTGNRRISERHWAASQPQLHFISKDTGYNAINNVKFKTDERSENIRNQTTSLRISVGCCSAKQEYLLHNNYVISQINISKLETNAETSRRPVVTWRGCSKTSTTEIYNVKAIRSETFKHHECEGSDNVRPGHSKIYVQWDLEIFSNMYVSCKTNSATITTQLYKFNLTV